MLLERGVQRMKQKRDKRNLSTNVKEDEGREENSDDWRCGWGGGERGRRSSRGWVILRFIYKHSSRYLKNKLI